MVADVARFPHINYVTAHFAYRNRYTCAAETVTVDFPVLHTGIFKFFVARCRNRDLFGFALRILPGVCRHKRIFFKNMIGIGTVVNKRRII